MTNKEYIIACLNDEIDDGGASYEACAHYYINCPYTTGDSRAACYDKPLGFTNRNVCSACKMAWLEEEADE